MTYGMLIDLKKCIGCHACSVACKEAHGTPPSVTRSRVERKTEGTYPNVRKNIVPMLCMHCENAPCAEVCPTGALRSFDETAEKLGVAVVQKDRCLSYFQGCTVCEDSCAFDALAFVDGHPVVDGDACNGCGQCEFECTALVYGTFAGGTRRGIVVVPPEAAGQLGRTVVEDGSEMGV